MRKFPIQILWVALLCVSFSGAFGKATESTTKVTIAGKTYDYAQGWWDGGKKTKWYEQYWRNGKKQLLHKSWSEKGVLLAEETYRDDYLHGPYRHFHGNGKLATEASYHNGAYDGVVKTFDEAGRLQQLAHYISGVRDGLWTRYHPVTGQPKFSGNFVKGQPTGDFTETDPNGNVLRKLTFKNGVPVISPSATSGGPGLRFATGGFEGWNFNLLVRPNGDVTFAAMEQIARVADRKSTGSGVKSGDLYYQAIDRIAVFRLTPADQRALAQELRTLNILNLKEKYADKNSDDATQWHVAVVLESRKREIDCRNEFPDALRKLHTFLDEKLLPHYELELETSRVVEGNTVSRDVSPP